MATCTDIPGKIPKTAHENYKNTRRKYSVLFSPFWAAARRPSVVDDMQIAEVRVSSVIFLKTTPPPLKSESGSQTHLSLHKSQRQLCPPLFLSLQVVELPPRQDSKEVRFQKKRDTKLTRQKFTGGKMSMTWQTPYTDLDARVEKKRRGRRYARNAVLCTLLHLSKKKGWAHTSFAPGPPSL